MNLNLSIIEMQIIIQIVAKRYEMYKYLFSVLPIFYVSHEISVIDITLTY